MRVALAQINPTVGDLEGNVNLCLAAAEKAARQNPDLIIFPQYCISGCHPQDILLDKSFVEALLSANQAFARALDGIPPVLFGSLANTASGEFAPPYLLNAAWLVSHSTLRMVASQKSLIDEDVYFDHRWLSAGGGGALVSVAGEKVAVFVGLKDLDPEIYTAAELAVVLGASPFTRASMSRRLTLCEIDRPVIFSNLVGGNDELIYDGRSFIQYSSGQVELKAFESEIKIANTANFETTVSPQTPSEEELVFNALSLGMRDFFKKNHLKKAFLGVSGGIDSSLVAAIAADALGPGQVTGVAMPSRYNDPRSESSAEQLCKNLGIQFDVLPIKDIHTAAEQSLGELLSKTSAAENVQARIRMLVLMAFVNHHGGVLLNCGNKTEAALGYATIYGDSAGTLCPIADLNKTEVYALAHWVNRQQELIPAFTMNRKPSAELSPGQIDPFDYERISPEIDSLIRSNQSNSAMRAAEHKRWQSGVILKVSPKAFGSGRKIPITRK